MKTPSDPQKLKFLKGAMKAEYDELKRLYQIQYHSNSAGIITGAEFFELSFALIGTGILLRLEATNGLARFYLFEALKNDLEFHEFLSAFKSRYSSTA